MIKTRDLEVAVEDGDNWTAPCPSQFNKDGEWRTSRSRSRTAKNMTGSDVNMRLYSDWYPSS